MPEWRLIIVIAPYAVNLFMYKEVLYDGNTGSVTGIMSMIGMYAGFASLQGGNLLAQRR